MAFEQLTNGGSTTLSGAMDNSTDPITFNVVSAATFPSVGNFRIKIDSEILLVTSVSTNTFTANRAQEGTSIASHLSGAAVNFVLTKGSVNLVVGEYMSTGNFSDAPTFTDINRKYYCQDTPYLLHNTGSGWSNMFLNSKILTPPSVSNFSGRINNSREPTNWTLDNTFGVMRFLDNGSGLGSTGEYIQAIYSSSYPAGNWQCTFAMRQMASIRAQATVTGLMIQQSSTGYICGFTINNRNNEFKPRNAVYEWSSATAFSGTAFEINTVDGYKDVYWLRIQRTGSNTYTYQQSTDGNNWMTITKNFNLSGNLSSPDRIGIMINVINVDQSQLGGVGYGAEFLNYFVESI